MRPSPGDLILQTGRRGRDRSLKVILFRVVLCLPLFLTIQGALASDNNAQTQTLNEDELRRAAAPQAVAERARLESKRLREVYEAAKTRKDVEPLKYVEALMNLAFDVKNSSMAADHLGMHFYLEQQADNYFKQALQIYATGSSKLDEFDESTKLLWDYLRSVDDSFDDRFATLMRATDLRVTSDTRTIYDYIDSAIRPQYDRDYRSAGRLWKVAVDTRSSLRGQNDKSLSLLLYRYSDSCFTFPEAEKTRLRALSLTSSGASARSGDNLLTRFYIYWNRFDKAAAALLECEKQTHKISDSEAQSYIELAKEYERRSLNLDVEQIVGFLLARGGSGIPHNADPFLTHLVEGYIATGELNKAVDLITKRIGSPGSQDESGDLAWKLKLSNLKMALGNREESDRLFAQVKSKLVAESRPSESIDSDRAALFRNLGRPEAIQAVQNVSSSRAAAKVNSPSNSGAPANDVSQGDSKAPTSAVASTNGHRPTMTATTRVMNFQPGLTPPVVPARTQAPAPTSTEVVTIRFGLLAKQQIEFGRMTQVSSYFSTASKTPPMSGISSGASICCLGPFTHDAYFRYDGSLFCHEVHSARKFLPIQFSQPTLQEKDIKPALNAPPNAVALPQSGPISPGDYVGTSLPSLQPGQLSRGRIRIFLQDGANLPPTVTAYSMAQPNHQPADFQIWYNGSRTLSLRGVCALVYAPNAVVRLGGSAPFYGAIVAREIIGEGTNPIVLDRSLINVDFR